MYAYAHKHAHTHACTRVEDTWRIDERSVYSGAPVRRNVALELGCRPGYALLEPYTWPIVGLL